MTIEQKGVPVDPNRAVITLGCFEGGILIIVESGSAQMTLTMSPKSAENVAQGIYNAIRLFNEGHASAGEKADEAIAKARLH